MRLKVVSDGTFIGTSVMDAESGEVLQGVEAVDWACHAPGDPVVTLKVRGVKVELIGAEAPSMEELVEGYQCGYKECPGGHPTEGGVCKAMFSGRERRALRRDHPCPRHGETRGLVKVACVSAGVCQTCRGSLVCDGTCDTCQV